MLLKKFLPVISLCISIVAAAQQDNNLIKWSASRKLKWQDYLAAPDSRSSAAATTSTQLGFEYHVRDNDLTYTITCYFAKDKSWGRYKNDYILSHEQGHFDIAEIFARRFFKTMKAYHFNANSYKTDLKNIYSSAMKEKEQFQQQYDNETDYSRNEAKQKEWLKKINSLLEETNEYAEYNL
ncbi:MAG: DUF922 domain-containing protein [Chitinophagaceae bacterium]